MDRSSKITFHHYAMIKLYAKLEIKSLERSVCISIDEIIDVQGGYTIIGLNYHLKNENNRLFEQLIN